MTREEALQVLKEYRTIVMNCLEAETPAFDMAIEALSAEAEQVTGKLKKPCDSLLTGDSDECKEQKSKLESAEAEPKMTEEVREALMRLTMCAREECDMCKYKDECGFDFQYKISTDNMHTILEALSAEAVQGEWIPCNKQMPDELEAVNITWVNHNPPPYYKHIEDVPLVDSAVYYRSKWYWWDATVIDVLAEYGEDCNAEQIDKDIDILAWMPLPEPYKGGDDE